MRSRNDDGTDMVDVLQASKHCIVDMDHILFPET
jgi:hypothetical protein